MWLSMVAQWANPLTQIKDFQKLGSIWTKTVFMTKFYFMWSIESSYTKERADVASRQTCMWLKMESNHVNRSWSILSTFSNICFVHFLSDNFHLINKHRILTILNAFQNKIIKIFFSKQLEKYNVKKFNVLKYRVNKKK